MEELAKTLDAGQSVAESVRETRKITGAHYDIWFLKMLCEGIQKISNVMWGKQQELLYDILCNACTQYDAHITTMEKPSIFSPRNELPWERLVQDVIKETILTYQLRKEA